MFFLNKTRRRVLFWLAVGFFILAAPLIIGFSQGLRFDFATRQIVRVGAISLDSDPDEARIYFNGDLYNEDTPAVIRGLLPGHLFHIRVEEDGYYAWEKTLTVEPQRITSSRGIHLFLQDIKFESVATGTPEATHMSVRNDGNAAFLYTDSEAHFYSIEDATSTNVIFPDLQKTLAIENVEWHQNGSHILFSRRTPNDQIWYVWDVEQELLVNLNERYSAIRRQVTQNLSAPEELNAAHLVFLRNGATRFMVSLEGRVYILNTTDLTISDAGIDNIAFLYSSGNRFFIVNGESTLIEIDSSGNIVRTYGTLGFIPERMLLSPNGQRLFYESNGRGVIVWLQEQELDWHREVGDIDVIFEEEGEPLSVWWHDSSAYVISEFLDESGKVLVAYEIDIRDTQNVHKWTMSDGVVLYYAEQGSRLYRLENLALEVTEEEF